MAKKPHTIEQIEIKWNKFIPFNGYLAITFFGKMWMKNKDKDKWKKYVEDGRANVITNHEMIHVKQAVSTGDSWWKFYFNYIWQWLRLNPLFNGFKFAYNMNPFEIEAYGNEVDMGYTTIMLPEHPKWKYYADMSVKIRNAYWKV